MHVVLLTVIRVMGSIDTYYDLNDVDLVSPREKNHTIGAEITCVVAVAVYYTADQHETAV